jgi:RNA recognition motif-containing protein
MRHTASSFNMSSESRVNPAGSGTELFVRNLPFKIQSQELRELFQECGNVVRADVAATNAGRSRGVGTVVFATPQDAQAAVARFDKHEWEGRKIQVREGGQDELTVAPATGRQLFVGNLPSTVGWKELKDLFNGVGSVVRADVSQDREKRSKGHGTVVMASAEAAEAAIQNLNGSTQFGQAIEVRKSDMGATVPTDVESTQVYVQNLPYSVRSQGLKKIFKDAKLEPVHVELYENRSGLSRGCGIVRFASKEDAARAVQRVHGSEVDNRTLLVRIDELIN